MTEKHIFADSQYPLKSSCTSIWIW